MQWEKLLSTNSLDQSRFSDAIKRILSAALEAANPADAVTGRLTRAGDLLRVNGREYSLKNFSAVYLISVGKAAIPMADAASSILGEQLSAGLVISKVPRPLYEKNEEEKGDDKLAFLVSSHPIPDERSLAAAKKILDLLKETTANDLVLFLISGGGSALITLPVDGVSLAAMEQLTTLLLGCGARIDEINTLRRALDRVKGGGLAEAAFPAEIISLLLSDVVNSSLEAIASGPTVANPTSCVAALAVLEKSGLCSQVPSTILGFLEKERQAETSFLEGNTLVVGSNTISAEAAKNQARLEGFYAEVLTTSLQGEASQVGRELGKMLREEEFSQYALDNVPHPFCLILGGETTVTLNNAKGHGGRNQELALAAVQELAGVQKIMLITLASDGEDGPTDAAGAVVTGETLARAQALGLDVDTYLRNHNAHPFFDTLDDLLKIASTGTNVNDLTFLFGF